MPLRLPALALLLLISGCGEPSADAAVARDSAAQRARDSAIGASGLPGATGITGSLKVADSAAARRQREDSIATAP
jgi:hypothetical protein